MLCKSHLKNYTIYTNSFKAKFKMPPKTRFSKTELGIIILTGLLPFSFALNPTSTIDLSIIRILIPTIFLVWLTEGFLNKKVYIDTRLRAWFLIFLLALASFSCIWAPSTAKALRKILFLVSIIPVYWVFYTFFKKTSNFTLFLKILFGAALISAILGIGQFFSQFIFGIDAVINFQAKLTPFFLGNNFSETVLKYNSWLVNVNGATLFRAIGLFPDPHLFGLFLNIVLATSIFLYFKKPRLFYLSGIITILLASLLTFSRAGYLSLLLALIFTWFKFIGKKNIWNILLVLAFASFILIPNPINQRFYSIFNFQDGSVEERLELWKTGIETTKENPWGGVGIGNLSEVVEPFSDQRIPIYAHNLFLDFSSETGILGGLVVFLILFSPIISGLSHPGDKNFLIATIFIIITTHSMFETPFYSVSLLPLILGFLTI